ncbi:hypothetical protein RYX36_023832 [Vicia faba]
MEGYKRWVRQNKEYVHSLESLANGLTWLLLERFSESEIGPEAVTTVMGIVTAINEHIIDSAPDQNITGSVEPNSFPYPLCLSALKDLETLVEVVAQHYYGDDRKWNFLAVTEGIKVLVRLSLFRKSGYKMLLHGGETSNDDSTSQHQIAARALSALSQFGEKARMVSDPVWLRRVQHQQAIVEPAATRVVKPTLSTILSKKGFCGALFLIGEVLFIVRPLIYVLFIRKYGIWSWTPWFLSLAIDTISNSILSLITTTVAGENQKMIHISAPEKDEVKRRKLLFVLYLMRDPFFSKYTRRKLESTEKVLEPVPIIGFLTASKTPKKLQKQKIHILRNKITLEFKLRRFWNRSSHKRSCFNSSSDLDSDSPGAEKREKVRVRVEDPPADEDWLRYYPPPSLVRAEEVRFSKEKSFFGVFEAMEGYKRWVRQNKEYVHSLESLANGLTWLLPERFSESEIGPEAVTTVLGIVTAINEHIIDSAPDQNITGSVEPNSFPYPLCLSALKDLETLVEVVAQHYYGDDRISH